MRKMLAIVAVLALCTAANAQMSFEPIPAGWDFTPRTGTGDTIYLENTGSGYFAPQAENGLGGFGDDIHWSPNPAGAWSITGFSFSYFSRSSFGEHQGMGLDAKIDFWENDVNDNFHAGPIATFTMNGLATGLWDVKLIVPKFVIPKDIWMSVQFRTPTGGNPSLTGLLISADGVAEVGGWSNGFMTVYDEQKNLLGLSWFGGDPPGTFLIDIQGKKVPEPMTLGLLALGGLMALRRRR